MNRRCHLFLEGQRLSAWVQDKGQLRELASFTDSAEGLDDFSAFLAVHRKNRFAMLLNLPGEVFARETLPKLRRYERQQLLESRSSRLFPETPWRCAVAGKTSANGETDFLLMAQSNTAPLNPWLERLSAASAALESVHSLPQLLPALLHTQAVNTTSLLTLSLHEHSVRFSLLIEGKLHYSRLATLGINSTLRDELRRFVDHVSRQHRLDPPPSLCVIANGAQQADIDLPGITQRINTPAPNGASLFLSIPARHWPREQLAPPGQLSQARQQQQIAWTWRTVALICVVSAVISIERLNHHDATQSTIRQEEKLRQAIDDEIHQNDQPVTLSGLNRAQLQQLARDYPALLNKQNAFEASLLSLSRAMDDSPAIELDSIDWKIDHFPSSTATMQIAARVNSHDRRNADTQFRDFLEHLKEEHATHLVKTLPASATASGFPFALQASRHELR
jgi:hypothetical protein